MQPIEKVDSLYLQKPNLAYHLRQFDTPYRSTVHLGNFITGLLDEREKAGTALDVACGSGANIFYFSKLFPKIQWTGVDISSEILAQGKPRLVEADVPVQLVEGNLYGLEKQFGQKSFDIVFCLQTLFSLQHFDDAVAQLLAVTRRWLFISTLLTDSPTELEIKAIDYSDLSQPRGPFYYNIPALSRFRNFCTERGAVNVIAEDFQIDIDLPPPEVSGLSYGTYTRKLVDGQRLQFSGPLFLPWKFVAVKMM